MVFVQFEYSLILASKAMRSAIELDLLGFQEAFSPSVIRV